jgi:mono/diheme cytochrome c family protein
LSILIETLLNARLTIPAYTTDECNLYTMIVASQINQLVNAFRWLTWLLSLCFVLLAAGLTCFYSGSDTVDPVKPQVIDDPRQPVKSVVILTPDLEKGKLLFATHCQQCHELSDSKLVGPGLLGVSGRVPDQAWLLKWIKRPSALLNSGDVYANQLVKVFAPVVMPGFPMLKDTEVKALIDYIDSCGSGKPVFVQ